MKKILFVFMIAGLMAPAGLMAQKVYKSGTMIILDMSQEGVGIGMNVGTSTNVPKTFNNYTPDNYAFLHGGSIEYTDSQNDKVFQKLEIAKWNLDGTGTPAPTVTIGELEWDGALIACRDLNYNGNTGWRLPTHRELQMIWIFRTAIGSFGDPIPIYVYHSATENGANSIWVLNFNGGVTLTSSKNGFGKMTRCVREITP